MRRTTEMLWLLLVAILAAPVLTAQGAHLTAWSKPDGSEVQDVSRAVVLSEGAQQMASGELAITNLDKFSYSLDLRTGSLINLCVRNYRSTSASDVWVEVWASKQIPQIGGDLTHHTGLTYQLGTVSGFSTRCVNSGAVPLTPPDPGLYWISIVLYEGSGAGRTLQFIYTDPEQADIGGPFTGTSLDFLTPASYYITASGSNASIQVARIRNLGGTTSRPLRLALWVSVTVPRYGETISAAEIAYKEFGPLLAGYGYPNVDTGSLSVDRPPAGTYWITAALLQLGTDGTTWYYNCLYTFATRYTFTGATAGPTADFTFTPASPTVGQSVSFTDTSTGSPTSWSWNFGDGGTSTTRNPTRTFAAAGSYSVSLTATNAGGSNTRTKTVVVAAAATAPVISSFSANPSVVTPGQQTTLYWTSTGDTSASIDQGVGSVPTSGSKTITPTIGVPYKLTVTGPGGSTSATVTIAAVPSSYAGTWLLPSSARVSGQNAFWTTDLVLMNAGSQAASVNIKFLGHEGSGATGPERIYAIPARATFTFADVLSLLYGKVADWGPILIRSSVPTLVVHGQTWTASPTGGSYGQSVPALGPAELVGASPKGLAGLRQDAQFRTNIVLANVNESSAAVTLQVLLSDGTTATTQTYTVGPLGFLQLNLANNLGLTNFTGGSVLVSCSTPGCQIAAYASVIDAATADPRTILAR